MAALILIKKRMKLISILFMLLNLFISVEIFSQPFSPPDLPGLQLWLRADSSVVYDAGFRVSEWDDLSGNNYNVLQADPSSQPLWMPNALNNKPAVCFDGLTDYLFTNFTSPHSHPVTMFIVYTTKKQINVNQIGCVISVDDLKYYIQYYNGSVYMSGGSTDLTYPHSSTPFTIIGSYVYDSGNSKAFENGILMGSKSFVSNSFSNSICIGKRATPATEFHGDIAEIIIYNDAFSDTDRQKVENYLNTKYGEQVSLGADTVLDNFCPYTLNAGSQFTNYTWQDGSTGPTYNVVADGVYSVTVSDIFGNTSSDEIKVTYPAITLKDTFFCAGSSIVLSTGVSGTFSYLWSTAETSPTITVNSPGSYSVTVTDYSGCMDSVRIFVTEDNFPVQASLGNDATLCNGNLIGLVQPNPLPNGLSYSWLPNGETTPSIIFTAAGTFTVTVTDLQGCSATDNITVAYGGVAPVVDFTYVAGCSGDSTRFYDASDKGTAWSWDFGDGSFATDKDPVHLYATGGIYHVKLTVSEGLCSNSIIQDVFVRDSPIAAFSVSTACEGNDYPFIDQSDPVQGNIISWNWDFGNGSNSSDKNTLYAYTSTGTYNVILTVTNNSGCSNSVSHPITVADSAPAPSSFTLYNPPDNLVTSDNDIFFGWNISAGVLYYTLQYSSDPFFPSDLTTSLPYITSTGCYVTFDTSQTYYWRVIAYNSCGDSSVSQTLNFTVFSDSLVQCMTLWLKADKGTLASGGGYNYVSKWEDQGTYKYDAIQSDQNKQPTLIPGSPSYLNGKPVLRFDGIDDVLVSNITATYTHPIYIFMVYTNSVKDGADAISCVLDAKDGNYFIQYYQTGINIYMSSGSQDKTFSYPNPFTVLGTYIYNGDNSGCFVNGVSKLSSISFIPKPFTDPLLLGSRHDAGSEFKGDLAEIIIYHCEMSIGEQQIVEEYLMDKYGGGPVNLGADIISTSVCGETLFAGASFSSYLWSTNENSPSIIVHDAGVYSVTVTDIFGRTSVDTIIVTKPTVTAHDTIACVGSSYTIYSGLTSPYISTWDNTYTGDSYTVTAPAVVNLEVKDQAGCSLIKQIIIAADSFPLLATLGNITGVCTGQEIGLAVGANEAITYTWSDSTHGSLFTVPDTVSPAIFSVTVTDTLGCKATQNINATVLGQNPVAEFAATAGCEPFITSFTNTSSVSGSSINNWNWNFGDGFSSQLQDPDHAFTDAGIHLVTLTVTAITGCQKSHTDTVFVYSNPVPVFKPLKGCSGMPLNIKDYSSNLLGDITSWSWNFGDPSSGNLNLSNDISPVHTFDTSGTYYVHLDLLTEYGCADDTTIEVVIRDAPDVGFTYSSVCDGYPVYFNDTTITQPWTQIQGWLWDFGDSNPNSFSTSQNPSHNYDSAGTYYVTLTVKSLNGCSSLHTDTVVVHEIPNAGFDYINGICSGKPHAFTDASTVLPPDSIVSWLWDFGSYGSSTNSSPVITVSPDDNMVSVLLTVTSNAGCKNSVSHDVNVFSSPTAAFIPDEFYGVSPDTVNFTNNSLGAVNYCWDFGDGTGVFCNEPDPTHIYTSDSIYTVTMIAYSQSGCTDTARQEIYVVPVRRDIAVTNVKTVTQGNFIILSADINNYGSSKEWKIDLFAKPAGGAVFKETWTNMVNRLSADNTPMNYTFNAHIELFGEQEMQYICVEAQIAGYVPDDDPSNNEQCITFGDEFVAFDPYPAPVNNVVNLGFILPFSDNVQLELFGVKGDKVAEIFNGKAEKGFNKISFDVSALSNSVYIYRISFRDNEKIMKFVKY